MDTKTCVKISAHIVVGTFNFLLCGIIGIIWYFIVENRRSRYERLKNEEYAPIGVFNRQKKGKKGSHPEKPSLSELLENPKHEEKMNHIFRELIMTERTFVGDLQKLDQMFIQPIMNSKPSVLAKRSLLHSCFKKLSTITKMNEMFLKDLESCISMEESNIKNLEALCRTIIQFSQPFKMYVVYISNFDSYESEISKSLKRNKRFKEICRKGHEELKSQKSRINELQSFTITPIQRLPRILLMMKELGKYVMKECEEYDLLNTSIELISETSSYCNKKTKEIKNLRKLKLLDEKYKLKTFLKPHTKIIKEGIAFRVRKSGNGLKSHLIILNDLIVCSPIKKPKDLTWFKKPYIVRLDDRENTKIERKDYGDIIVNHKSPRGKKKKKNKQLWLRFDSHEEREKYFGLLENAARFSFSDEIIEEVEGEEQT